MKKLLISFKSDNVIFIEWVDSRIAKAKVFDWNGPRVNGKKTYRFTEVLLQDDEHPVYMYWEPIIVGQATEETEADEVKISTLEIEEEEEIVVQDTTSSEAIVPIEIEFEQYDLDSAIEKAETLKGSYLSSQENQDFMDALLYQGIINRVEFYKYSDKWGRYAQTPQMNDLRKLLLLIEKDAGLENSIENIPTNEFTKDERAVFLYGETCNDCGDDEDWYTLGLGNLCDEEECFVLGIALGENCWYENRDCTSDENKVKLAEEIRSILDLEEEVQEEICEEGYVECEERVQEVQEVQEGEYNVIDRGEWIDIEGIVLVKEEYEILEDIVERTAFIGHVGDLYESGRVKVSQEHVIEIDFNGFGLTDISFLENFPELRTLNLNSNSIEYISVLSSLSKLNKLEMEKNYVSDLSSLSGLNSLNYLNMNMNNIIDVSPLRNLENLQEVYMESNRILDIIYLQKRSLVRLNVKDNCLFSGEDYGYFEELAIFLIDGKMKDSCKNEQYVRNYIYASLQGLSGDYSLDENKKFVDALYAEGFLTETEYEEIIGGSWWQIGKSEKDMKYVEELFYNKFIN